MSFRFTQVFSLVFLPNCSQRKEPEDSCQGAGDTKRPATTELAAVWGWVPRMRELHREESKNPQRGILEGSQILS